MKIKKMCFFVFCLICSSFAIAQSEKKKEDPAVYAEEDLYEDDPYYWSYSREIGVNFTPLISKFVPFNLGENQAGIIGLRFKKYYSTRAFRINFGAQIDNASVDLGNQFVYLSLGMEKRHMITKDKKWAYTSGWDIFFKALGDGEGTTFGLDKSYGFEYHFTKRVYIGTEAQLNLGIESNDGVIIEFQLPTAIFVNVRLY